MRLLKQKYIFVTIKVDWQPLEVAYNYSSISAILIPTVGRRSVEIQQSLIPPKANIRG